MAQLKIEFQGTSTFVHLGKEPVTVGRSNRCTVWLPDPGLDDTHFRIDRKQKGLRIKDSGSRTGTRLNGKTVVSSRLKHGDVIEAGGLRCTYLEHAEETAPAARPAPPPKREPPPPPAAPRSPRAAGRRKSPAVAVGVFAVVALVGVLVFLMKGEPGEDPGARELLDRAHSTLRVARKEQQDSEHYYRNARAALTRLMRDYPGTQAALSGTFLIKDVDRALKQFSALREAEKAVRESQDIRRLEETRGLLARLNRNAHQAILVRVAALRTECDTKLRELKDSIWKTASEAAGAFLEDHRFGPALRVWRTFRVRQPAMSARADKVIASLEQTSSRRYENLLAAAKRTKDPDARILFLEAARPTYRGTRQADDLEVRISGLRARRYQKLLPPLVLRRDPGQKEPATAKGPTGRPPTPQETGPYVDPKAVAGLVAARRFAKAAAELPKLSRHPLVPVRRAELELLAGLKRSLVDAVAFRPEEFTSLSLPGGVRGDASGADETFLRVGTGADEVRVKWGALPPQSFVRLFRMAGLNRPPRLAVALFYDEYGLKKRAEQAYVAYFKEAEDKQLFHHIYARRRGIDPPPGGFLLHDKQLVTPAQRDYLLLQRRLRKLERDAGVADTRRREAAWAELKALGEPGREILHASIKRRQNQVAEGLSASKAFSRTRALNTLGRSLDAARDHALKMIMDPKAYPYPSKVPAAQQEVDARVNKVRQIYERPYELLLEKSEQAGELAAELRELDERLARMDPDEEPDPLYPRVVERIQKTLDMKTLALDGSDQKRISYNERVMEYNRTLEFKTIELHEEERANVRSVNEYRWMMGLRCVKIDERLVRAARKHSIEMRQLGYFAHPSPTASLRSPGLRARREGYGGGVSENIAQGPASGHAAFEGWYGSSGHHRNMCQPNHTELGCGQDRLHWWTQKFGSATGRSLDAPKVAPDPDPPGESGNGKAADTAKGSPPPRRGTAG